MTIVKKSDNNAELLYVTSSITQSCTDFMRKLCTSLFSLQNWTFSVTACSRDPKTAMLFQFYFWCRYIFHQNFVTNVDVNNRNQHKHMLIIHCHKCLATLLRGPSGVHGTSSGAPPFCSCSWHIRNSQHIFRLCKVCVNYLKTCGDYQRGQKFYKVFTSSRLVRNCQCVVRSRSESSTSSWR